MAAEYLRLARKLAGLPDIELSSIWAWDDGEEHPGQVGGVRMGMRSDLLLRRSLA
jgi:hypothetical protein